MDKVIFDTNAYRYLVKDKTFDELDSVIAELKTKEAENNIETLMSPIVVKELLAHIAVKSDPSYSRCYKALKALYLHNSSNGVYRMLASPELLISKAFFNAVLSSKIETSKALGQILYHISINKEDYNIIENFEENLFANREHVISTENDFAETLKNFVNKVDPTAVGWKIFEMDSNKRANILYHIRSENTSIQIALGYLFIVYKLLIQECIITEISSEELYDRAREFIRVFPEPISLFKQVMENLVNSNFDVFEDSRANFVWDIHLMFNVGNHSIGDSKLNFVTSDKAIIRTALQNNTQYSIYTFEEYVKYLG